MLSLIKDQERGGKLLSAPRFGLRPAGRNPFEGDMVARSILRRASSFAWVLGCIDVQGAKAEDGLIKFSINSSPEQASPGVDGSWPALTVLYGSAEQPVDCFLSFLNESMFVTQATCSEAL